MSGIVEKIVSRGAEPFEFTMEVTSTDEGTFNLDSDAYHGEDGYFKNKTLYITGLRVVTADAGDTLEYIELDGEIAIHQDSFQGGLSSGDDVILDGGGTDGIDLKESYMAPIPVRMEITLKASAYSSGTSLYLQGWALDQDSEISHKE